MISYQQFTYIMEGYKNLFDYNQKEKYVDDVWEILQSSYKAIGGIKGNGFSSKDDMMNKIPFWKVITKNSKVVGVVLYKDKSGRKVVASGTDGSAEAKELLVMTLKPELSRSFGEKSKASLGLLMKSIDWNILRQYMKTPSEVKKISRGDDIVPISSVSNNDLPSDAQLTLKKYPQLKPYGYLREIGGTMVFKVMVGTANKTIK